MRALNIKSTSRVRWTLVSDWLSRRSHHACLCQIISRRSYVAKCRTFVSLKNSLEHSEFLALIIPHTRLRASLSNFVFWIKDCTTGLLSVRFVDIELFRRHLVNMCHLGKIRYHKCTFALSVVFLYYRDGLYIFRLSAMSTIKPSHALYADAFIRNNEALFALSIVYRTFCTSCFFSLYAINNWTDTIQ